jgi:hypothetical protein
MDPGNLFFTAYSVHIMWIGHFSLNSQDLIDSWHQDVEVDLFTSGVVKMYNFITTDKGRSDRCGSSVRYINSVMIANDTHCRVIFLKQLHTNLPFKKAIVHKIAIIKYPPNTVSS